MEEPPPETREERVARLLAEMEAPVGEWNHGLNAQEVKGDV